MRTTIVINQFRIDVHPAAVEGISLLDVVDIQDLIESPEFVNMAIKSSGERVTPLELADYFKIHGGSSYVIIERSFDSDGLTLRVADPWVRVSTFQNVHEYTSWQAAVDDIRIINVSRAADGTVLVAFYGYKEAEDVAVIAGEDERLAELE